MAQNFSSRWGVVAVSEEEKLEKYRNRVLTITGDHPTCSTAVIRSHAYAMGERPNRFGHTSDFGNSWFDMNSYIRNAKDIRTLAYRLELLLNSQIITLHDKRLIMNLTNSSHIGIRTVEKGDDFTTYPEGQKVLDEHNVEKVLTFLDDKSNAEFVAALERYSANEWAQAAEKIRRTLEEYLRGYLGNKAGFQANIKTLGKHLKDKGIADHFRSEITSILNTLDQGFNDSSKHWTKTSGEAETEFLIYTAGALINVLHKVEPSDEEE